MMPEAIASENPYAQWKDDIDSQSVGQPVAQPSVMPTAQHVDFGDARAITIHPTPNPEESVNPYAQYKDAQTDHLWGDNASPHIENIPATTPKKQYTWAEAIKHGITQVPSNLLGLGKDMLKTGANFVMSPWDTTMKGVGAIIGMGGAVGGAVLHADNEILKQLTPEGHAAFNHVLDSMMTSLGANTKEAREAVLSHSPAMLQHAVATANAVAKAKMDEYISDPNESTGSALRRTIYNNPVTPFLDASTAFAGGAGLAGAAGKTSLAAGLDTAAGLTNPINLIAKPLGALAQTAPVSNALASAGKVLGKPANALRYGLPTAAQDDLLSRATEGRVAETRDAMSAASAIGPNGYPVGHIVPNAQPNAGNIASQMPQAPVSIAAMQRDANINNGSAMKNRGVENSQAMQDHLHPIGRDFNEHVDAFGKYLPDPTDLAAAKKAIDQKNYGDAKPILAMADDKLLKTIGDPVSQRAEDAAKTAMSIPDEKLWIGENKAAVPAHEKQVGTVGKNGPPIMEHIPETPAEYAMISGDGLQTLKGEYDALIYGKPGGNAPNLSDKTRAELLKKRNDLVQWIADNHPELDHARQSHATMSKIEDRLNMGDSARKTILDSVKGEDSAIPNAKAFANAVSEGPNKSSKLISSVTGDPRGTKLSDFLTPAEMQRIRDVSSHLSRDALTDEHAVLGKKFNGALNTAGTDFIGGNALASVPIAKQVTNFLMNGANKTVADRVGKAMFYPDELEALLSQSLDRQAQMQGYKQSANALYNRTLGTANDYPTFYPAMQTKTDEKKKKK